MVPEVSVVERVWVRECGLERVSGEVSSCWVRLIDPKEGVCVVAGLLLYAEMEER